MSDVIDKYRVIKPISEGAAGVVFLVEAEGKQFALKHLKASDDDTIKRFRREISTLARLNHENMVQIFDVGEFKSAPYMVMDYLEGKSLAQLVKSNAAGLNLESALKVVTSVAKALTELHKNNLVHRDIKPANIIETSSGVTKLIDLGLVGDVDQIQAETALTGTPLYASPEQSRVLKRPVDFRSDLYSLGVTFFELVSGKLPFDGTLSEILHKHAAVVAPDARAININIPASISSILKKLLAKDPDDRYQSAVGLLRDLGRLAELEAMLANGVSPDLGAQDKITLTVKVKYVQRDAETTQLKDCWQNIKAGNPGVAIISGPSGSGKSRLCEEFLQSLNENELLVIRAKCQFFDLDLPFAPIREAIDGLFDEISSLPEAIRSEHLNRLTQAGRGSESFLVRLAPSFRRIFPNIEAEAEKDANSGDKKAIFLTKVSGFFANICDYWKSVVILIDDLQWLDQSTLAVLNKTFEGAQNRRLLLMGTARDDEPSRKLLENVDGFLGNFVKQRIAVERFTKSQMEALIHSFLGNVTADAKIAAVLNAKSSGNPFIAIEFLRSGIEQGYVYFKNDSWGLNEVNLEKIALAENVYKMILDRVATASVEAKEILNYAALLGGFFRASDLAKIKGMEAQQLMSILQNFQESGLIDRTSSDKWRFAHDKVIESVRASMDEGQRQKVAFSLASYFLAKGEKSPDEVFALARLCSMVDSVDFIEPTISANLEAGKLSVLSFAHQEGYKYLRSAFDSLKKTKDEQPQRWAEVASNLAICATMVGDWDLAEECARMNFRLSEFNEHRFDSQRLMGWVLDNRGDGVAAWDFFRDACATAGEPYPWYLQWKLLQIFNLGLIVYFCELFSIKSLPRKWGKSPAKGDIVAHLHAGASIAELLNKPLDMALIAFKLIILGKRTRDPRALGYGYFGMSLFLKAFGPILLVDLFGRRAEAICDKISDLSARAKIQINTFMSRVLAGLIRTADVELAEKLNTVKDYFPARDHGLFIGTWVRLYAASNRFDLSLNLANSGLIDHEKFIKRMNDTALVHLLAHKWLALNCLGKVREAQSTKKLLLQICNKMRFIPTTTGEPLSFEMSYYRYLDTTDERTYELMETALKRVGFIYAFPAYKQNESLILFACLDILESAKHSDLVFSLSRKFKQAIVRLLLSTYNPEFRMSLNYLLARYFSFQRHDTLAGHLYDSAEQFSIKYENARLLFDIYRDKANLALRRGDEFQMNIDLGVATQIALSHQWLPLVENLKFEFEHHLEKILMQIGAGVASQVSTETHMSSTHTSGATHVSSGHSTVQGKAHTTIQGKAQSTAQGRTGTIAGTIQDRADDIGDIRFIDALLNVSTAFVSSIDLVEQSHSVLIEIVKLFAAERGFVFLKDDESSELRMLAGKNSEGTTLTEVKGFSNTVVKKVLSTGTPLIVTGTEEGEALGSESAVLHNLRSIMATPLNLKGVVLGVVYVDSSLTKGLFTNADIELFSTLANHISVAFELSRMTKIELEKANLRRELDVQTAVAAESKKVKVLVDNVQQSLFSVTQGGAIVEPISRYSENIFQRNIAGDNVMSVLFRDIADQAEQYAAVDSTMTAVFGEDELQWSLMKDNIPSKIIRHEEEDQILKIKVSPLWDDRSNLEKMVFVVEDITDLEGLEIKVKEQQERASMLEEIFSASLEDSVEFFEDVSTRLAHLKKSVESLTKEGFANILRELHTLKGNSRLFNLRSFSGQVHKSETGLIHFKDQSQFGPDQKSKVNDELQAISAILDKYRALIQRVAQSSVTQVTRGGVNQQTINGLLELIGNFEDQPSKAQALKIKRAINRLAYRPISEIVRRFDGMIKDIGSQLGKNVQLKVVGEALIDAERVTLLQEALLHLVRNSLDHGIESGDARAKASKPEVGTITIICKDELGVITLKISDDGGGMDAQKIVSKAVERGIISKSEADKMSEREKINLIFRHGFSTKEAATDISGRGIGMDVVKANIGKLGGEILADTKLGVESAFTIVIPEGTTDKERISS